MSGRNKWPPPGFRPVRPEESDPDKMVIVALPPQQAVAQKPQPKAEEISRFWRMVAAIGRRFGRP